MEEEDKTLVLHPADSSAKKKDSMEWQEGLDISGLEESGISPLLQNNTSGMREDGGPNSFVFML